MHVAQATVACHCDTPPPGSQAGELNSNANSQQRWNRIRFRKRLLSSHEYEIDPIAPHPKDAVERGTSSASNVLRIRLAGANCRYRLPPEIDLLATNVPPACGTDADIDCHGEHVVEVRTPLRSSMPAVMRFSVGKGCPSPLTRSSLVRSSTGPRILFAKDGLVFRRANLRIDAAE